MRCAMPCARACLHLSFSVCRCMCLPACRPVYLRICLPVCSLSPSLSLPLALSSSISTLHSWLHEHGDTVLVAPCAGGALSPIAIPAADGARCQRHSGAAAPDSFGRQPAVRVSYSAWPPAGAAKGHINMQGTPPAGVCSAVHSGS